MKFMYRRWLSSCVFLLLLMLFPAGSLLAQDTRAMPVYEIPRPDYDPQGIRAGGFLFYPELTLGLEYNDNIYATRRDTESDWITTIAPELDVRSNWTRHALGLNAGLESGLYASESDENYLDGHIMLDGRLDMLREAFFTGRTSYHRLHEERGAPDADDDWDEPARYNRWHGGLGYYHGLGKLSVSGGADVTRLDYENVDLVDGTRQSLSFRDRNHFNVFARTAYEIHPQMQPFLTARYNWRLYDERDPGVGDVRRDSEGYRIGAGTGFDLPGVLSGEIFAGYMHQNYDNLRNISGAWYGMGLLWNVTRLTSVEASAERSVKETIQQDSAGIEALDTSIRIDHELLRNLLIGAFFDFTHDSYKGRDITDKYYVFGPRVTYLWNRNLSAEGGYIYRTRDSNVSDREYTENRFQVSITGAF